MHDSLLQKEIKRKSILLKFTYILLEAQESGQRTRNNASKCRGLRRWKRSPLIRIEVDSKGTLLPCTDAMRAENRVDLKTSIPSIGHDGDDGRGNALAVYFPSASRQRTACESAPNYRQGGLGLLSFTRGRPRSSRFRYSFPLLPLCVIHKP